MYSVVPFMFIVLLLVCVCCCCCCHRLREQRRAAERAANRAVPVHGWPCARVCAWLDTGVDLPSYQQAFREASVDGPMLLQLTEDDLQDMLARG